MSSMSLAEGFATNLATYAGSVGITRLPRAARVLRSCDASLGCILRLVCREEMSHPATEDIRHPAPVICAVCQTPRSRFLCFSDTVLLPNGSRKLAQRARNRPIHGYALRSPQSFPLNLTAPCAVFGRRPPCKKSPIPSYEHVACVMIPFSILLIVHAFPVTLTPALPLAARYPLRSLSAVEVHRTIHRR